MPRRPRSNPKRRSRSTSPRRRHSARKSRGQPIRHPSKRSLRRTSPSHVFRAAPALDIIEPIRTDSFKIYDLLSSTEGITIIGNQQGCTLSGLCSAIRTFLLDTTKMYADALKNVNKSTRQRRPPRNVTLDGFVRSESSIWKSKKHNDALKYMAFLINRIATLFDKAETEPDSESFPGMIKKLKGLKLSYDYTSVIRTGHLGVEVRYFPEMKTPG